MAIYGGMIHQKSEKPQDYEKKKTYMFNFLIFFYFSFVQTKHFTQDLIPSILICDITIKFHIYSR
jgi:hypothetical protein